MSDKHLDKYLKPEDVAAIFGLSRPKVMRYCNAQRFPHLRFGQEVRFTEEHIEQIRAAYEQPIKAAEVDEQDNATVWGHRGRRSA